MKKVSFEIEGQVYAGQVEQVDQKLWVHFQGETHCIDLQESQRGRRKKRSGGLADSGDLVATMPGKVVKLFISQGDRVEEGDSVLVLEAMKMEYTLKAGRSGVVGKMNLSMGDQVTAGQLLVSISGEKSE